MENLINKLLDEDVDLFERNYLIFTEFKELPKDVIIPFIDEVIKNIDKIHVSILHGITMSFGNDIFIMFDIKGTEYNKEEEKELEDKLAIIENKVKELLKT